MKLGLWVSLAVGLLVYPLLVNDFWVVQIGGRTLGFGTIALSLIFLMAYTGMLSLAQMSLAGVAGYAIAYFTAPIAGVGVDLGWPLAFLIGVTLATLFGFLIGLVSVRTGGIYTMMITLAIAMGFYYLTLQNYAVFNGFTGFTSVRPPSAAFSNPLVFYYACLAVAAIAFTLVLYIVRTPFGLALQAVRDNPRRLRALGYHVASLRILAFGLAGFLAGLGGVLNLLLNGSISPGSIDIGPTIDVLMAAVLGGLGHPVGAYIGAFVFTVIKNFAIDLVDRERFNTLIGLTFLAVVLFSPDGLVGISRRLMRRSS